MWKALTGLVLGGLIGAAHAQPAPSPADVGVSKGNPDVFKLLDSTKTWTPFGSVNTNTHVFAPGTNGSIPTGNCVKWGPGLQDAGVSCGTGTGTPAFSEADLMVTDPAIGMASGATDNLPFVSALMSAISPSTGGNGGGYDVLFPGVHGQAVTEYYFSNSLDINRGARFHCSGAGTAAGGSQTYLLFAPGVDGVVQNSFNMTLDGGGAAGTLSGCNIWSMGYGSANGNPVWNTNLLTSVSFYGDPAHVIASPTWHVGDGLILVNYSTAFYPPESMFVVPLGTTVTAVDGGTGNLTLSNPATPYAGHVFLPKGTAVFTETGSNNFSNGDTIQVGATTYTFVNVVNNSLSSTALIGPNYAASAANLVALVMHTAGEGVTYWPDVQRAPNPQVTAAVSGGTITFTSVFGSPAVNTFPSVYTHAGTAAGTFGGTHFTGANDASNCPSPCSAMTLDLRFFQLPKSQEFKIQTTVGSHTVTVVSGPRPLQMGDVIWSDAFPFGTTVGDYQSDGTGTTPPAVAFPYNVTMTTAANNIGSPANATVAHAAGAEGNLWIMPAGVKRRAPTKNEDLYLQGWGLGESMACAGRGGANAGLNCDLSRDRNIWHRFNVVGRWASGGNYSTTSSIDEQFAHNYFADMWEGGTLGEVYVNPNGEDPEANGGSSFLMNCSNQNYTTIFGAYIGSVGCVDNGDLIHSRPGGPLYIGSLGGPQFGVPEITGSFFRGGPFTFTGGYDNQMCAKVGDGLGGVGIAVSSYQCATGTTWNLSWDPQGRAWTWYLTGGSPIMTYIGDTGFKGYAGNGFGIVFENGIELGNISDDNIGGYRILDSGLAAPTAATWHLWGDTRISQHPFGGGNLAWANVNIGLNNFLNAAVTVGQTAITINACPNPAPPAGTPVTILQTGPGGSDQILGTVATCVGTALTLQGGGAAVANALSSNIAFLQWRPTGLIANDAGGTRWTLGNYMSLIPVALASLPATCTAGTFAVINNGVASPAYNAAVGSTTGATTNPVFCGTGNVWTYH